jgi:hypothetical protein
VRKVFIRFELGLDSGSWVTGKVLILLGFDVGDIGKVFISNKKSPGGKVPQGLLVRFLDYFKYKGFEVT